MIENPNHNILSTTRLLWALVLIALASCAESEEPVPEVELSPLDAYTSVNDQNGVIYVEDLPGAVGNTYESGHVSVFYSLANHQIINDYDSVGNIMPLSEELQISTDWDIAFTGIYNSYITINNGSYAGTPGAGGDGVGKIIALDAIFDEYTTAPESQVFDDFMMYQVAVGWENYPPGDKGWYFYSLDSHISSAISGVTIVLQLADGKYAKLEMKSIYLDNPEKPTVNTPAPYFTFRYFIQEDGSKNLQTTY